MIVPPPAPVYSIDPSLDALDAPTLAAVERCVAGLSGHARAVLVTRVARTGRHLVVEMETALGAVLMLEPLPGGVAAEP